MFNKICIVEHEVNNLRSQPQLCVVGPGDFYSLAPAIVQSCFFFYVKGKENQLVKFLTEYVMYLFSLGYAGCLGKVCQTFSHHIDLTHQKRVRVRLKINQKINCILKSELLYYTRLGKQLK